MIKISPAFFPVLLLRILFALSIAVSSLSANAGDTVSIENAWVRATIPGQDVGAAYMTFNSRQDVTLTHVESDVTSSVEIHSMSMQNGVMKMRMLKSLPLKAGKPYKLEPGGFHLMLFDLKQPLTAGQYVSFVLTFKSGSKEFRQTVKALVKTSADTESNVHHHH